MVENIKTGSRAVLDTRKPEDFQGHLPEPCISRYIYCKCNLTMQT